MRPKLIDYAFFAPVENGVLVRAFSKDVVLRGADLYDWTERLAPFLDGKHDVADLTRNLSSPQRAMIESLIERLIEAGLVRDAEADLTIEHSETSVYAPALAYLEQMHQRPTQVFEQLRRARVLASGSGPAYLSLVRTLVELGIQRLDTSVVGCAETLESVGRIFESCKAEGMKLAQRNIDQTIAHEILSDYDAVVHVTDPYGDADALRLLRACMSAGTTFLAGGHAGGQAYAGPLNAPDSSGCLECALVRLEGSHIESTVTGPFNPTCASVLGNVVAVRLFNHLTDSPTGEENASLTRVDSTSLSTSRHPLVPWPKCPVCREGSELEGVFTSKNEFRSMEDGPTVEEFVGGVEALTDELTGILGLISGEEYEQLPVYQIRVISREVPKVGFPGADIVVCAVEEEEARYKAARAGLAAYARGIAPSPESRWARVGDNAVITAEFNCPVFVTGLSYWEWLGTGLLEIVREMALSESTDAKVEPLTTVEQVTSREVGTALRSLKTGYELTVQSYRCSEPDFVGEVVILCCGEHTSYLAVDTDTTLAYERCVLEAFQSEQNMWSKEPGTGPVGLIRGAEAGVAHDLPSKNTHWHSWVTEALRSYEAREISVFVQPTPVDHALSELGLLSGYIAISTDMILSDKKDLSMFSEPAQ